ncbi:MAG TPA: tail fiber protein [Ornithinibacter sp.]|nr:tail fiber protein [Ornithinibacter sp.]
MTDPFVAEIRLFPFNFPPKGWAFCNGQLLPISQNTALFSLLGTTYGGDGKSTFALPDLQGRVPVNDGQGPGLSVRDLGEQGGSDTVTLLQSEIPAHTHVPAASAAAALSRSPSAELFANESGGVNSYAPLSGNPQALLAGAACGPAGGSLPHNNLAPYLVVNFCIALQGVFPQRP